MCTPHLYPLMQIVRFSREIGRPTPLGRMKASILWTEAGSVRKL